MEVTRKQITVGERHKIVLDPLTADGSSPALEIEVEIVAHNSVDIDDGYIGFAGDVAAYCVISQSETGNEWPNLVGTIHIILGLYDGWYHAQWSQPVEFM